MDLKDIGFEQLLTLVRQLPEEKLANLKAALKTAPRTTKKNKSKNDFRALLLTGPVMGDTELKAFKANREKFVIWRKN